MPAATNIPITATTTDFLAAINAATAATRGLIGTLNNDLVTAFRAADRADSQYQAGLGRISRILAEQQAAASRFRSQMADSFKSVGTNLSTYLTAPMLLAGGAAYKAYADIDGLNKGLKVVTGSAEGATKQFGQFFALSQKPGLGLSETVQAGLQLQNLGYQASTAQKYIAELGNAIALGGKGKTEFNQVIVQFEQMSGKAKVLGDDLKPIINASPVIAKAIADMFGTVDSEQISKKLQALGKTPRDFIASLVGELSKLERVESGPLTAIENFGDATKLAGFEFGKAADSAFNLTGKINGLGNLLISGASAFGETSTTTKAVTLSVLGFTAAIGPMTLALGVSLKAIQAMSLETSAFRVGLSALTSTTGIAVAAAAAVAAVGYAYYQAAKPVVDLVSKTELLGSVNKTAANSILAERAELDKLYKTATDETKSKEARLKAIQALNRLSPEYLGFLNLENINSNKAAEAILKQGQAILYRARARAAEDKLTDLTKQRLEVQDKPVEDFKKPLSFKFNKVTGQQEIMSPSEIQQQAQQFKNDALLAIDKNIADVSRYVDLNNKRADRRGINLDIPLTPTFDFKGSAGSEAYAKLKNEVDSAEGKIKDFIAQHGAKAKVPIELQAEFNQKSALLQAADNAVKTIKPKLDTHLAISPQLTSDLAIAKRFEADLTAKIQNAGYTKDFLPKADPKLIEQLHDIRDYIEGIEGLTAKSQKINIVGIAEIASNATKERVAGIVEAITKIKQLTPALFANTSVGAFLTSLQQSRPTLEYIENKIEEIKKSIAEATNQGFDVNSPQIKKLVADLAELKKALAAATGAASAADAATNSGAAGEEDAKYLEKAQKRIADMKAQGKEVKQTAEEMANDMKEAAQFLKGQAVQVLEAVGEGLTQGNNPLKTALQTLLNFLGDYMIKIGSALVIGGTALTAAEAAAPFLAPLFNIKGPAAAIAGGALVVGGGVVKGLASVQRFAKGGVFDQDVTGMFRFGDYAGSSINKEFATPQRLMGSVMRTELENYGSRVQNSNQAIQFPEYMPEIRLRGSDLRVILRRADAINKVYGS